MKTYAELGKLVKQVRIKAELNQQDLAKRLGVSYATVSNAEAGIRRLTLEQAFRLEKKLAVEDGRISNWIIRDDYYQATGTRNWLGFGFGSGTSSLNTGVDGKPNQVAGVELEGKIDGKVIRVPVKLPKNLYLKLEFE